MKENKWFFLLLIIVAMVYSCTTMRKPAGEEFKGKIAKSYEESKEWWPEK